MVERILDDVTDCAVLRCYRATGGLRCRHDTEWDCRFQIEQLLNGRLRVSVIMDARKDTLARWPGCDPFVLEGAVDDSSSIAIRGVYFTHIVHPDMSLDHVLRLGYAQHADVDLGSDLAHSPVALEQELCGATLTIAGEHTALDLDDLTIEVGRRTYGVHNWRVQEHAYGYRHAFASHYLRVPAYCAAQKERVEETLALVRMLLSLAIRAHVFAVSGSIIGADDQPITVKLTEPPFTEPGWGRALIPGEHLRNFVQTTYRNLVENYERLDLALVFDHYFQALKLRSAWAMSLGIFTAMETLKSAFFRQQLDSESQYLWWVAPESWSRVAKQISTEIIEVLARHFDRFGSLGSEDRNRLSHQICGMNRRSYKVQLRRMMDLLQVEHSSRELQSFVDIRNEIIHGGQPAWEPGWVRVEAAIDLFEKTLLALLGYAGPREPFGAGLVDSVADADRAP